jgi:hypothetical protein
MLFRVFSVVLFLLITQGCAQQQAIDLSDLSLPKLNPQSSISCQYEKSDTKVGKEVGYWYFMRQPNRTESRDDLTQQGQIWEKDPKGNITMTHLFHQEKVALEYSSGELAATGKPSNWNMHWSIINPQQLKQNFVLQKSEDIKGVKASFYKDHESEIVWLPDLQLPAAIKSHEEDAEFKSFVLKSCLAIDKASVRPTTETEINQYRRIDFSDLGDMETDPVVKKIEALLGGHSHDHQGH